MNMENRYECEIPEGYEARIEENKVVLIPKESEDEKIREEIITYLRSCHEPYMKEWISYLERQKEQKPAFNDYLKATPTERRKMSMTEILEKEQKPKMIQWTGKNLKEVIDFTGKSPRFDEWFKSWDDFENYVHTHNDILKLFCEDGSYYEVPIGAWIVKTPDGYNTPSCFRFIQKSAEWSEEDEDMRYKASAVLNKLCASNEEFVWAHSTLVKVFYWLKSLRPQPHWKPSEEQMDALKYALGEGGKFNKAALESLYEQLKKL